MHRTKQNKQYIEQNKTIHRTTQNKQYIEQNKQCIQQNKTIHRTKQNKQYIEQNKQYIEQNKQYIQQNKTIHRTTQNKQYIEQHNNYGRVYYHKRTWVFVYSTHYSSHTIIGLEFLENFSKNTQISNLVKIRPVGAELFHADGQANAKNLIDGFRNLANVPKKGS